MHSMLGIKKSARSEWLRARPRRANLSCRVFAGSLAVGALLASAVAVSEPPVEAQVPPGLVIVRPTDLVFNTTEGEPCNTVQMVAVLSALDEPLDWEATSGDEWLQTDISQGTTPAELNTSVTCTDLPAGMHSSTLVVASLDDPTDTETIAVTVIVNPDTRVRAATWRDGHRGAFSVSVDDSQPSGFSELVANGLAGTFVMTGTQPPSFYDDYFAAGQELGSHLVSHPCGPVSEAALRYEIEANVAGVVQATGSINDVVSLVWPCGYTDPGRELVASEYFLSARGYNINSLEDATPANFMNLKSYNSHEHTPFRQQI